MDSQMPNTLMCGQMQADCTDMKARTRDVSPSTRSSDGCCSDRCSISSSDIGEQEDCFPSLRISLGVKNTFFSVSWSCSSDENEDDVIAMGHSATEPAALARMGSIADSPRELDAATLQEIDMCTTLTGDADSPQSVVTRETEGCLANFCNMSTQLTAQKVCTSGGMVPVMVPFTGHQLPSFFAVHVCNQAFIPQTEKVEAVRPIEQTKNNTPQDQPTSIILRNLPLDMTRHQFLKMLNREGFAGKYDLVYLPRDFKTSANLGYAFVNLVEHSEGVRMQKRFAGFCRWPCRSAKKCETAWSSQQGVAAYIERYRNNPVMHRSVPDEFKPALFQNRAQVAFPEPTRALKAPTLGSR